MGIEPLHPFERLVTAAAWCLAVVLCIGVVSAPPRSAMESAGRFVFLWPALARGLVAAGVWHWCDRARRAVRIGATV